MYFQTEVTRSDPDGHKRLSGPWSYGKGCPRTPSSFTWACHALPFYARQTGHSWNGLTAVSAVARPQSRRPAAVFYPIGHPGVHSKIVFPIFVNLLAKRQSQSILLFQKGPLFCLPHLTSRIRIVKLRTVIGKIWEPKLVTSFSSSSIGIRRRVTKGKKTAAGLCLPYGHATPETAIWVGHGRPEWIFLKGVHGHPLPCALDFLPHLRILMKSQTGFLKFTFRLRPLVLSKV
jgi:hypothetical protein